MRRNPKELKIKKITKLYQEYDKVREESYNYKYIWSCTVDVSDEAKKFDWYQDFKRVINVFRVNLRFDNEKDIPEKIVDNNGISIFLDCNKQSVVWLLSSEIYRFSRIKEIRKLNRNLNIPEIHKIRILKSEYIKFLTIKKKKVRIAQNFNHDIHSEEKKLSNKLKDRNLWPIIGRLKGWNRGDDWVSEGKRRKYKSLEKQHKKEIEDARNN